MKQFMHKLEDLQSATAFAELGFSEIALELIQQYNRKAVGTVQRLFAAIAFAEADEALTAREILTEAAHLFDEEAVHLDDCQFGDNDFCYAEA